jgi:signal transduction histidine kinase
MRIRKTTLGGIGLRRLRWSLALFFLALAAPTVALIYHALDQLKWEAFHRNRVLAEELAQRIDGEYRRLIAREEARPFTDYAFLNIAGRSDSGFLQRSPLSAFPPDSSIPGLIGYFQVDGQGRLSTPLLPVELASTKAYGIGPEEQNQRRERQAQIAQILNQNRLVNQREAALAQADGTQQRSKEKRETNVGAAEAEMPAQAAFDQLASSSLRDEEAGKGGSAFGFLRAPAEKKLATKAVEPRLQRKEQNVLPAPVAAAPQALMESAELEDGAAANKPTLTITTFESEIDPLEFSLLDSGQFVLFRKVWRNGERQIQGLLIEQQPFIWNIVRTAFDATALAGMADLSVSYSGLALGQLNSHGSRYDLSRSKEMRGELLYQTALNAPLGDIELAFTITRLPIGPGGYVVLWNSGVLTLVLLSGFYLLYRLGVGQIRLARQQQDFVSAVSHELKTPLTSIRMYGEMLRAGWVDEEKRSRYYDYIFDESERLSRLINNVLQLARMTRSELPVNLRELSLAEWMEMARAKVGVQIERAGFESDFRDCSAYASVRLKLDPDHFSQIMINLVDNAIKYSAKQDIKRITIGCELLAGKTSLISVRDYGPGIAKEQMKKIFTLFYRSENELTRETVGTGIGLALVHQLVLAMGGRIDVINQKPGAEFRLYFPITTN